MTFKLAISCAGLIASAGAAVTRANHRTAIAVEPDGGTRVVDVDVPHVDALLQSLRGGLSDEKGAAKMVSLVEDLAKRAAAKVGDAPDMALVEKIKDFAQSILDNTNKTSEDDKGLLQDKFEAIERCPDVHNRLMTEAVTLRGSMETHRTVHESCREAEVGLAAKRSSHCDEYDNYRAGVDTDMDECTSKWFLKENVAKDENVDKETVKNMERCLEDHTPWIEKLHELYLACDAAAGTHDGKVEACNKLQVEFEHGFCEYHLKLGDHCDQMTRCYDNAVEDQATTQTQVKDRQEARKSDWVAGSRIACYAKVFEADQTAKETVLSGCRTEDVSTEFLNLTYKAPPAKPECTSTDSHPCEDPWQKAEYTSKGWYATAPTAECRPCSQK